VDRKAEVSERLRQAPPAEQGVMPRRWTLVRIRSSFEWLSGYSLSGVWRLLKGLDFGWRGAVPAHFSPDPAYADKQEHLLSCLRAAARQPGEVVLVFIDEMGFSRWPQGGYTWMSLGPRSKMVLPCAANNRQWRLIGSLNAVSGQVTYLDNYIVGRQQVGLLYQQLDRTYPLARHIFVVQDNWSIHTHPDVLSVLSTLPRLETVSLPTYAHWLNPIEKLWRWLRQDVLRLHQWAADWPTLLSQVHTFLDQFAQPSPNLLRYVGLLGDGKLASLLRNP
jgi:DDE superfamily endonuclease